MNDLLLERLFSVVYTVLGLSLIAQSERWRGWFLDMVQRPGWPVRWGALPLVVGAVLVVWHNTWTRDFGVILTALGWWAVLKGLVFLLAPDLVERAFGPKQVTRLMVAGRGLLVLLLAILIGLHAWFGR